MDIDLVVHGACSLRPGVKGISDRIRVRSIVGRFLEHSRIFYFANGGESDIYLGSADWMPRNLYERVEVMFPVKDGALRHRILCEILENYLEDKDKSRIFRPDGNYVRAYRADGSRNGRRFSAQDSFIGLAEAKPEAKTPPGMTFRADGLNGKPTP